MKEASLMDVKRYFDMPTTEFMKQWKAFSEEEKKWWKIEIGKDLYPDEE